MTLDVPPAFDAPAEGVARPGTIFTIGYATRTFPEFLALLDPRGIDYVADVRTRPYSKRHPEFARAQLAPALEQAGLRYVYMGHQLGGLVEDPTAEEVDYEAMWAERQRSEPFLNGLARLLKANAQGLKIALMCAELRPEHCHRCALIGQALEPLGLLLRHIDADGGEVLQPEAWHRRNRGQGDLFRTEVADA